MSLGWFCPITPGPSSRRHANRQTDFIRAAWLHRDSGATRLPVRTRCNSCHKLVSQLSQLSSGELDLTTTLQQHHTSSNLYPCGQRFWPPSCPSCMCVCRYLQQPAWNLRIAPLASVAPLIKSREQLFLSRASYSSKRSPISLRGLGAGTVRGGGICSVSVMGA